MKTSSPFMRITEPPGSSAPGPAPNGFALLRLGFRPFYLAAAILALISVPIWLLSYFGRLGDASSINVLWHMHEMVYGFAVAVVFGFLYTAVRNWTGLWTPRATKLGLIAVIWVIGRIAMFAAPPLLASALDLLFIPVAIVPLVSVMLRSGKKSNLPLLVLPSLIFCTNLCFHLAILGWISLSPIVAVEAGILVLAVLSTVMAGRVVPGFTQNMASGSKPRDIGWLSKSGTALIVASSISWTLAAPSILTAALAMFAGVIQLIRLGFWQPERTTGFPLLWILHLAFGWIGIGYVLLALSEFGVCSTSTAMHAIAVGGMSSLILGMMARTTIGHTGRPMRAEHNERVIFFAIQCAAVTRVLANVSSPNIRTPMLIASGLLWALAFLTFLVRFAPFLSQPRIDHREG